MGNAKILILGAAVIDVVIHIDRLPQAGEDIAGRQKGMIVGGCAFNVSKIMGALGTAHDLCVPLGKGMYADIIRQELLQSGHWPMIEDERCDNGYCLSLVEADSERTFITMDGIETMWLDAWLDKIDAQAYDYIYASGYGFQDDNPGSEVLLRFLRRRKRSCRLVLDPGPRLLGKRFADELLGMRTILEMNEAEAKAMTGEANAAAAARRLYAVTRQPVVVTLGREGTLCRSDEGEMLVPSGQGDRYDRRRRFAYSRIPVGAVTGENAARGLRRGESSSGNRRAACWMFYGIRCALKKAPGIALQ